MHSEGLEDSREFDCTPIEVDEFSIEFNKNNPGILQSQNFLKQNPDIAIEYSIED